LRILLTLLLFTGVTQAQTPASPVPLLDVPYISQTEALCGGAAAAMVLRYWGERGLSAESFAHLVDRSAAGIRTDALTAEIASRGWNAAPVAGEETLARNELRRGRPVLALIEDRPGTFHYVVIVAWHERGIVFHDPARAPFRVMAAAEFTRRWNAADSWMLVLVPSTGGREDGGPVPPLSPPTASADASCAARVAEGVQAAQANDLGAAERALISALACPGPAASRELAGVRLLQRRWPEVSELAAAAVAADPGDGYAWKLLGTSRFVQDDRAGALAAWNHVGEPRVDLVRIDGLTRTRHRIVERLIGVESGALLTPASFARARRRVGELPSATSARLEFVPVPSGLAEVRGAVNERDVMPAGRFAYAGLALSAAATREVRMPVGSFTGGGERLAFAWRFWPHRPRVGLAVAAPAPWGGVWALDADWERQPFDVPTTAMVERSAVRLSVADWATGAFRWQANGGIEQRGAGGADRNRYGLLGGRFAAVTSGDLLEANLSAGAWLGANGFATGAASLIGRSTTARHGLVFIASAALQGATAATPQDLWFAGDTGHARPTLLRAHPVIEDGRLRLARLGRVLIHTSMEGQHWWPPIRGLLRTGAAVFVDAARTGARAESPALDDLDVGAGVRLAVTGLSGFFRVDLGKSLRNDAMALSLTYVP
jgi:hypothetical protein